MHGLGMKLDIMTGWACVVERHTNVNGRGAPATSGVDNDGVWGGGGGAAERFWGESTRKRLHPAAASANHRRCIWHVHTNVHDINTCAPRNCWTPTRSDNQPASASGRSDDDRVGGGVEIG
jgi:hypothetical protein